MTNRHQPGQPSTSPKPELTTEERIARKQFAQSVPIIDRDPPAKPARRSGNKR